MQPAAAGGKPFKQGNVFDDDDNDLLNDDLVAFNGKNLISQNSDDRSKNDARFNIANKNAAEVIDLTQQQKVALQS